MLRLFLWVTLSALFAFPSISEAYYIRMCWEDHSKLPMKTHAQTFVEDVSAPRDQQIKAMECLGFYGKEGVPTLSKVLERELNRLDSRYAVEALGRIQDRSVMEPLLRLLVNESKGGQQSGADWNSTSSINFKPRLKIRAVEILGQLAMTSLEKPNPQPAILTKTTEGWIIKSNFVGDPISFRVCGGYHSKGELLRSDEINRIAEVFRKIVESESEDTTERAKRLIEAASIELERIDRRMALLEKYGPKPEKASKSKSK